MLRRTLASLAAPAAALLMSAAGPLASAHADGQTPTVNITSSGYNDNDDGNGHYGTAQIACPQIHTMYVNFLSLAPSVDDGLLFPKDLEQTLMDDSAYPYLSARTGQRARFGIVPMDFPDFHV